jgi:hypothetical protein
VPLRLRRQRGQRLAHQRGFAHLPWPRHHLHKPARLRKALNQGRQGRTLYGDGHGKLLNGLSNFTQPIE